ncbi:hypothetical protein NDU88_003447 [Pleurodeles waltl]|uniref:Uncharacterized protein n=1 Tax=Pleurodeles waltl TaxID=8319 RepID=A0AAV7T5D6_PLEWA|nr:hypothetical protein NDU88_003447 [Pleurodeles waltl]
MYVIYWGAWPVTNGAARVMRRSRATIQARSLNPAIITTGGLKKLKRSDRRIYSTCRDRGDSLRGRVYPENSPRQLRDRAVNPLQLWPAAESIRRSRRGEGPHPIHRRARGAQTPSPQTARATVRSRTSANAA